MFYDSDIRRIVAMMHAQLICFFITSRTQESRLNNCSVNRKEDMEQINAEDNLYGNPRAMKKLIFMLRDRDDKWFVHLVSATRKCGYLLDDVNPRLKEAGHNF